MLRKTVLPQLKEGTEFFLNPKCYAQTVIILPKPGIALSKDDLSLGLRELEKTGKRMISQQLYYLRQHYRRKMN